MSGEEILNMAREFAKNAERKEGGNGLDSDGDGKPEYDCSGQDNSQDNRASDH